MSTPILDPATEPVWTAAGQGVLRLRYCTACAQPHWYPRPICPFCGGKTTWFDACGKGEIYSLSVTRRGAATPYAIAYVKLEEGISMLTNIVDCDLDTLVIGQHVVVCFKPAEDGTMVPMFRPA